MKVKKVKPDKLSIVFIIYLYELTTFKIWNPAAAYCQWAKFGASSTKQGKALFFQFWSDFLKFCVYGQQMLNIL